MSAALLFAFCSPPSVAEHQIFDPDFEQIYEIGTRLLGDIEHEKDMYGLGSVNFDNLYIDEYIPAYITSANGIIQSDIRYYPITENGEWIATLSCIKTNGIWNAQISNSFVSELPSINENDSLAIIFDNNAAYLSKNSVLSEIADFSEIPGRTDISNVPMTISELTSQKLTGKRAINIGIFDSSAAEELYSSTPTQVFLDVPLVTKHIPGVPLENNGACWAATVRAIGLYREIDKSIDQIYDHAGIVKYNGADNLSTSIDILRDVYKRSVIEVSPSNMPFSLMQEYLFQDKPIAAQAGIHKANNNNTDYYYYHHAVAIRGYVKYTNSATHAGSFSYIENDKNPAVYVASSISHQQANTGEYYYFSNNGYVTYPGINNFFDNFGVVS